MGQVDFAYDMVDGERAALAVAVYADRLEQRQEIGEDAMAAGLRLGELGPVAALAKGEVRALADVVVLDCPEADAATLAALSRLDLRAARSGAQLVVSTGMAALEPVFGCLDQSRAQILVEPTRAERVIALGRALSAISASGVRELSDDDRLTLIRLTEQVGEIAARLDRLSAGFPEGPNPFRLEFPSQDFRGEESAERKVLRRPRPPLPEPRLVRRIIRQRRLRAKYFDGELFADPAWDMLLDLTAARVEHARVSVTSLCIASGVPPTTALRWIGQMIEAGLFERQEDDTDRRRAFITLSDRAAEAMARYFEELGTTADTLI